MFIRPPLLIIRRALIVSSIGPNERLWPKIYRAKFDILTPVLRSLKCSLYLCYNDLPVDGSTYVNIWNSTVLFSLFMFHVNVLPTAAVLLYLDRDCTSQHTLGLLSSFQKFLRSSITYNTWIVGQQIVFVTQVGYKASFMIIWDEYVRVTSVAFKPRTARPGWTYVSVVPADVWRVPLSGNLSAHVSNVGVRYATQAPHWTGFCR
jgi:hypothetical protein